MKRKPGHSPWFRLFHACGWCGRLATWHYGPMTDVPAALTYYCDACIPRGCKCRRGENGELGTDAKGRLLPCGEYDPWPRGRRLVRDLGPAMRSRSPGARWKRIAAGDRPDVRAARRWRKRQA